MPTALLGSLLVDCGLSTGLPGAFPRRLARARPRDVRAPLRARPSPGLALLRDDNSLIGCTETSFFPNGPRCPPSSRSARVPGTAAPARTPAAPVPCTPAAPVPCTPAAPAPCTLKLVGRPTSLYAHFRRRDDGRSEPPRTRDASAGSAASTRRPNVTRTSPRCPGSRSIRSTDRPTARRFPNASAGRGSSRSPGASTPPATAASRGRSASSPGSATRGRPTSGTRCCWPPGERACPWPLTCPP